MAGAGGISNDCIAFPVPLLGFYAYGSNIGKTTLLTRLIPALIARGTRISVIKHAHHTFDIDYPGKDSYRLRESGAIQTLIASRHRWALVTESSRIPESSNRDPGLSEFLKHIDPAVADLIIVEGFKQEPIAKIEVCRPSLGNPLLAADDPHIIAIAADAQVETALPQLDLNDPDRIADFIMYWLPQERARLKLTATC